MSGGESGSHSGLDSDLLPVLSFLMGGVSPLSGLEPVLFRQRVHRLTGYTLFEDTSDRRDDRDHEKYAENGD